MSCPVNAAMPCRRAKTTLPSSRGTEAPRAPWAGTRQVARRFAGSTSAMPSGWVTSTDDPAAAMPSVAAPRTTHSPRAAPPIGGMSKLIGGRERAGSSRLSSET
jgi:hypothetical protein